MREEQQLKTFKRIVEEYPANTPLTKFLPGFFKKNKQMGSTDRRIASQLLYNFFRIGQAAKEHPIEDRLSMAQFLCNNSSDPFLKHHNPELNDQIEHTLPEKIDFLRTRYSFNLNDVFPFTEHLSKSMNTGSFLLSLFNQPDLFIRIHPGKEALVKSGLETAGVYFKELSSNTLALPNGTKLEKIFETQSSGSNSANYSHSYEVQDLSSQQTGSYFQPKKYEHWWDACAASGGKSLLLFNQEPSIKLVVSDIRESVLNNLDERFTAAGLHNYQKKVLDLTQNPDPILHDFHFDGIILDAPCTGSGTWGRTPEMISQFEEYKIKGFQSLQKSIATNVIKYLKPGKPLIYITCSVFKEENEDVVAYLVDVLGLQLEFSEVLKGYEHKADTMFVARLIR
jgi:16S rRNA (cytosine967-C5)-methyltransferase